MQLLINELIQQTYFEVLLPAKPKANPSQGAYNLMGKQTCKQTKQ